MFRPLQRSLALYYDAYAPWAIDIFPKLEVIYDSLVFRGGGPVLPGTGLAKLLITGYLPFVYWYGAQIPNMEFLQSLVCSGFGVTGNELGGLQSLAGLGRLADGIGTPGGMLCLLHWQLVYAHQCVGTGHVCTMRFD
eukprot:jgi/Botrbrau1/18094/Bobra.0589s0001.1